VAAWMFWRTRHGHGHGHDHVHEHHGDQHDTGRGIDTGHGVVRLRIFEQGVPPRFRLHPESGDEWPAEQVQVETERADGTRQIFAFRRHGGYLESIDKVPEPHEFVARLRLGAHPHSHHFDIEFVEHAHHHAIAAYAGLDLTAPGYQDPHELAHANDIRRRFGNRNVTTGQIVVFGLTGGLIPCPASITVLLLCLQLQRLVLGATLVLCFSIGLALTMVAAGALAALSVQHAVRRFRGFAELASGAPYLSGAVILLVGMYLGYQGLEGLHALP
jgi:nickel/cobalt transporter (NicO) family protein